MALGEKDLAKTQQSLASRSLAVEIIDVLLKLPLLDWVVNSSCIVYEAANVLDLRPNRRGGSVVNRHLQVFVDVAREAVLFQGVAEGQVEYSW